MRKSIILPALLIAGLPLAGCAEGRYGYGAGAQWVSHPYSVWYDGYYGPLYDGYWGIDGFFYFRLYDRDRAYRRGDPAHFHRGDSPPAPRYRRYEGVTRQPSRTTRMPSYPPRDHRDGRGDRDNRR